METEVKKTKFQSPIPIIIQLRNLVFGKVRPDIYTFSIFVLNLIIWFTFLIWHIFSYFAITSRSLIESEKGIHVEEIIMNRGTVLGFEPGDFLNRLQTFHAISVICWLVILIGLILLYRKKRKFFLFIIISALFYLGMNVFYLSFQYFKEDTTMYDKITLLILITSTVLHYSLMRGERNGGSLNFFGEADFEE
jgi:preprotein translocase subunit SecG